MIDAGQLERGTRDAARLPIGVWVGAAANAISVGAALVLLTASPGARFRGMEPEAQAFISLVLLAGALGLVAGLPASLYDLYWRRYRLWGLGGVLFALTPLPAALLVSTLVAEQKGILFD